MCDRVTGSLKIFESIISQNQGIRQSEKAAKILFLVLFPSSQLHLTQMTTITDTDLKNHVAYLNALTNLCSKFYYYFQRVTYAKNIHNKSLITLFRGLQFSALSNSYSKSNYTFEKQKESNNLTLNNVNFSYKISLIGFFTQIHCLLLHPWLIITKFSIVITD